jgi:hypothetical protein
MKTPSRSYTKRELTDLEKYTLFMASPTISATEITSILEHSEAFRLNGIVLVTTSDSIADSSNLRAASPERTACVQQA